MPATTDFLKTEVLTIATKKWLLDVLDELKKNPGAEDKELTFNVYSIVISMKRQEVRISNDIFEEIPDSVLSIDEFYNVLENYLNVRK